MNTPQAEFDDYEAKIAAMRAEIERLEVRQKQLRAYSERLSSLLEEIAVDNLGMSGHATQPKDNAGRDALNAYYVKVNIARQAKEGEE